ncbi:uncharacterized protein LOC110854997 [Folsomia candida]|uniref:Uncharacterized protein n=1 Tax=Folsomia candida TaxID=158441 RepID=A0A226DTG1_FOLCA|nr:uncharacterized protein LOC110854997 [Folsomia candida]OXA48493.1 hypothetical protein Fcan01_16737 [Folsomia candida]
MDSNYNANISTGYYDMWTSPNFMASIPYALLVATDLGTEPDNVKQGNFEQLDAPSGFKSSPVREAERLQDKDEVDTRQQTEPSPIQNWRPSRGSNSSEKSEDNDSSTTASETEDNNSSTETVYDSSSMGSETGYDLSTTWSETRDDTTTWSGNEDSSDSQEDDVAEVISNWKTALRKEQAKENARIAKEMKKAASLDCRLQSTPPTGLLWTGLLKIVEKHGCCRSGDCRRSMNRLHRRPKMEKGGDKL